LILNYLFFTGLSVVKLYHPAARRWRRWIEAVKQSPLLRDDLAAESYRRNIKTELNDKRDGIAEIPIFHIKRRNPESGFQWWPGSQKVHGTARDRFSSFSLCGPVRWWERVLVYGWKMCQSFFGIL